MRMLLQVRNYTREFAEKMMEIVPAMIDDQQMQMTDQKPALPPSARVASHELRGLWLKDPSLGDTWDDADLKGLCRYLLGAKGLNVPNGWEWIVPSHLWFVH